MQKVKITEKNFSSNSNLKKISYNNYGDIFKLSKIKIPVRNDEELSNILNIKVSADKFCEKIKKEIKENENTNKEILIFSYKNENKNGSLKNEDNSLRFILKVIHKIDYDRENIEIYKLNNKTFPISKTIQVKGYGNCKDTAISNALKNTLKKLDIMLDYNDIIIHSYKLVCFDNIDNSGTSCKVNVVLGDIG
ncbi:MAG: hypothetical protein KatS3mg068_1652 [Candidatus Sericytochromatia bacterium]|nr:MAG: hypothetical protein KatS3mg068_1652 [Candidatus Sericytochromatia bacterium]